MSKNTDDLFLSLLKELDRKYWDLCKEVAELRERQANHFLELKHVKIDAEGALKGVRIINSQINPADSGDPITVTVGAKSALNRLNNLEDEVAVLTDMAHGRIRPADAPDLQGDLKALTAYVYRLETLLGTRIDQLEDAVNWHDGANMENGHAPAGAPTPPFEPVDTSWHPYDVETDYLVGEYPVAANKRVVVMLRSGEIWPPARADAWKWNEDGNATIVAWRYAKEGE